MDAKIFAHGTELEILPIRDVIRKPASNGHNINLTCTNSPVCSLTTPLAQRICIVNPNRHDISRCVVAFNTYHALRNNHSHDIDDAVSSSDFTDLLLIACEIMRYFAGELLMLPS